MTIAASAVWRVRPSGSNTNGGGYDGTSYPGGTDYSQQNSAQASGTHGTASGSTAFHDTVAAAFTSAMVGNALYLTGTGLTTGWYFVAAYTSSTAVTLDRSPGTGTVGTWHLGGAWADYWTNSASVVGGNAVYVLGSGIPNPASYTYDYNMSAQQALSTNASQSNRVTYATDPMTPSYGSGGMAVTKSNQILCGSAFQILRNLWFVLVSNSNFSWFLTPNNIVLDGCVFDQNNNPCGGYNGNYSTIIGCEFFSSTGGSGYTNAIQSGNGCNIIDCHIHDWGGDSINIGGGTISGNLITNNAGNGIQINDPGTSLFYQNITNNTVDGNTGNGILFANLSVFSTSTAINNIISNHTASGKYGMVVSSATVAQTNAVRAKIDYNSFYNNTTNYSGLAAGTNDTALGTTPYVSSATGDYTLAAGVLTYANAFPGAPFPSH